MTDVAGFRATMGVMVPSTNTIVESDCWDMRIPGVTFHTGRIYIGEPSLDSDEATERLLRQVDASIEVSLRDVMTCEPDYLLMGMSAPTFWGGVEGNRRFVERVRALTGLAISTGADACRAALETFGAKRIAVLTPYQPVMRREIVKFFAECGFQVVRYRDLRSPSATAIARITSPELWPVLTELDGPDIDAIVQCGTNLSMVRLAAAAEERFGKPVIAINAATVWHAYRANGFADTLRGFGSLLQ